MIVRDEYIAHCSGVYLPHNAREIIVNFMEGDREPGQLPPLTEGWRAIAVTLSLPDARRLAQELLRRVAEIDKQTT